MRQVIQITSKELKDYFVSPIAYIVISIFLVVTGWFFFTTFFLFNQADLRNFFNLLPITLAFVVPAVTMRLFAEELNVGSYEILLTLPVTFNDIIFGNRYDADGADFAPREFIKFTTRLFEWDTNNVQGVDYDDIPEDVWVHHAVVKTGLDFVYYRDGERAGGGWRARPQRADLRHHTRHHDPLSLRRAPGLLLAQGRPTPRRALRGARAQAGARAVR